MKKITNHKSQQKLHIVFLDFDDRKNPLLGAGQAVATWEVGTRLAKKGHAITVISSKYPGYTDRTEEGITYKHIGLGSKLIKLNNLFYILLLPFTVRKLKADIIIECFTAPVSTLCSPLFTSIPVVALPSQFQADAYSKKYHLPFWIIEKIGVRFYKYFLPFTGYDELKMKKMNPTIISKIVPEGVSKSFFKIKRKTPKHILFLGRFDIGQKGIDLLLRAYAKIAQSIEYPLIIAGLGPDEQKVKQLISDLSLTKKVKIFGPAYGNKKDALLSESLCVAFSSRHEMFSCFALEALAAGAPLVAFDIPGISWTTKQVALKATPYDVDEYASLLQKMTNKKQMKEMSINARTFARKFTWEYVADSFESFFYTIIKREEKLHV